MNWRPISELPELDDDGYSEVVLLWIDEESYPLGYHYSGDWYTANGNGTPVYPTHWCSITPPNEPAQGGDAPPGYAEITVGGVKTLAKMDTASSLVVRSVSGGEPSDLAGLRRDAELAAELYAALDELVDWQNGPPLLGPKWEPGWNGAMAKSAAALKRWEERTDALPDPAN